MDKPLATVIKGKGEKIQIINIKKESRVITTGATDTEREIGEYYQLYSNGFGILDKVKTIP